MSKVYWIYTTRALRNSLNLLIQQKQNKGYTVKLWFIEDIADPKHKNIRNQVLGDRPDFLLLVGDQNEVPGYPLEDRHVHPPKQFDSDSYYSTPTNSYIPRIPTGRISSNNPGIVSRICRTLISYPADSSREWRQRVVLTGWIPHDPRDPEYKHDAAVQCLQEAGHYFSSHFEFEKSGNTRQRNRWGANNSSKQSLINTINHGASLVRYLGHGWEQGWGNIGDNEDFRNSDLTNIHVDTRLPLVISATCLTGNLDSSPSLAEKWQETCKAIGVWSSDIVSDVYFNDRITQAIFHEIVTKQERCVGQIFLKALDRMRSHTSNAPSREFFRKTCLMFHYLGDPDTTLAIPKPHKSTLQERSRNGPSITASNNTLLIGWTGTPNKRLNFMSSSDGFNFLNKVTLHETSPYSPVLCRFGGEYVVAWIGVGNHRINIMRSANGQQWTGKVTLNEKSWSSPSLTRFGGKLYLAWRGGPTNNRINILHSTDAHSWQNKMILDETTTSGPALTATLSNLILTWRGGPTNNKLNIMISSDGQLFEKKHTISDTTTSQPTLTNYMGRPMLAWGGVNNRLINIMEGNETSNYDDVQWGAKITWREKCEGGPSLTKLGVNLVCAWTGTDGRLNTIFYPIAP